MEPLSTAVATAVTSFIVDTGAKITKEVGAKAADAARRLAQAVLDRLGADPREQANVERYRSNPEKMQPAVEMALEEAIAKDQTFADQLQAMFAEYQAVGGAPGVTIGTVEGSVQIGNNNIQFDRTSGDVTLNR